jgi:hypothetical protein
MPELMELSTEELLQFYSTYPDKDPRNLRIGIVGETGDVAEKDLKDIKDRTLHSEIFRWLFPEMIPQNLGQTKWTESEIVLPRSKSWDESTISCMGVGAKRTGFHYDILIYDDIVGEAASHSDTIMKDALDWLRAAPGLLNDDITGEELFAGTRWKDGEGDVYGWLMKNMPFTPGIGEEPATGFKFSTESCYHEPTTEIRFKERFNTTIMEEIRKRAGDYLFNCNYRNMPTPPEGSKFANLKFYTILNDGDGQPRIAHFEDGTPDVHINQLARVSFLDPSTGGRGAKCENAIVIVGTDELNRHLLLSTWNANTGYSGAIEQWHVMNDRYVCWRNCYEKVGQQKEIAEVVLMRSIYRGECPFCKGTHRPLVPDGYTPPSGLDKNSRIEMYLEPAVKDGRVYVRKEHAEAIRQATMFPNGDLVDVLDAWAYAVKISRPYRGMEEEMDQRAEQTAHAVQGHSYSNTKYNYGGYR